MYNLTTSLLSVAAGTSHAPVVGLVLSYKVVKIRNNSCNLHNTNCPDRSLVLSDLFQMSFSTFKQIYTH